jgi:ABC-type transport system involved in cytochrome c biogenesis permease subunit
MFMLGAYLSHIDPQITTLVPVLKSFWLTLHVSVIAGSYGFLGVAAMISLLCLVLYALREEKRLSLDTHINYLSNISEIAIYIGLVLLLIGNLLGAIWANESWGRYWGWDPKETWTFISIIFYTLLVHMKYLQLENFRYWFNVASLGGFGAILMTYFGVNYYLAGMHSYATGDPVPIPFWVYLSVGGYVLLLLVSSLKRKNLIER